VVGDDYSKAESFNYYFSSVFTEEDESPLPQLPNSYPSIDIVVIFTEGVNSLLEGLDPCKACGPDNISIRFIKETTVNLAPSLTLLYQASVKQGRVPNEWKKAEVVCLFI